MSSGTYVAFYTANFKADQLCRRLNLIFMSPHEVTLKRISAKRFGKEFLQDLEKRNYRRNSELMAEKYK